MWQICSKLPLLPGYTLDPNLGRTKFNKRSHFNYINGVPTLIHEDKYQCKPYRSIDYTNYNVVPNNVLLYGMSNILYKVRPIRVKLPSKFKTNAVDKYTDSSQINDTKPEDSYIIYSKRVLCFDGILLEGEGMICDIRKVKIRFYLQDSTVEVVEPKVMKDEGVQVLEDGVELCGYTKAGESVTSQEVENILVYRQKVQFMAPMDGDFSNIKIFNIGKEVAFQGKLFKIVNCDASTRKFLNRCGIVVPNPIIL